LPNLLWVVPMGGTNPVTIASNPRVGGSRHHRDNTGADRAQCSGATRRMVVKARAKDHVQRMCLQVAFDVPGMA
jgi:hypothetical protein